MRALEREAAAQRELLESYLTRYREAIVAQGTQLSAGRCPHLLARHRSRPSRISRRSIPIVGAALAASLLIMAIVTLLQELFSGRAMRPAAGIRPRAHRTSFDAGAVGCPDDVVEQDRLQQLASPARRPVEKRQRRPKLSSFGEVTVETAAEKLIAGGAARAIFISPEGNEAAAAAVMVAREVADAGLRVLLLDLTSNGAASRPMLESAVYPGHHQSTGVRSAVFGCDPSPTSIRIAMSSRSERPIPNAQCGRPIACRSS